jgi:hypothetical protein
MSDTAKPGAGRRERQLQLLTALSVLTVSLGADGADAFVYQKDTHGHPTPTAASARHGRHHHPTQNKHIAGVKYAAQKGGGGTADFTYNKRGVTAHSHAKVTHNKVDTQE